MDATKWVLVGMMVYSAGVTWRLFRELRRYKALARVAELVGNALRSSTGIIEEAAHEIDTRNARIDELECQLRELGEQ